VPAAYKDYLPLTIRQIFYRLVGTEVIGKSEKEYANLCELLNRARRARLISMIHLRFQVELNSVSLKPAAGQCATTWP
jgi:hypothetical protein